MRLYNFHSSSTSYRVRIALGLKELTYENIPVQLDWEAGDTDSEQFRRFNPQGNVPVLVDGESRIAQSVAILEYLEERYPRAPLLPAQLERRARARSLVLFIACEMQPLGNLRTERFLSRAMHLGPVELRAWRRHWIARGLDVLEAELSGQATGGDYCLGGEPGVVDCFLIPQIYNALRPTVGLDLQVWPTLHRIYEACMKTAAFTLAHPTNQPGYQELQRH